MREVEEAVWFVDEDAHFFEGLPQGHEPANVLLAVLPEESLADADIVSMLGSSWEGVLIGKGHGGRSLDE